MTVHPFSSSTVTVDHLQFAQNGVWEDVKTVYPDNFRDLYNLSTWLAEAARDIAVEAIFMDETSEIHGFFGVRTKDMANAGRTLMWIRLATLAAAQESIPFSELMNLCLTALNFPPSLPDTAPTFELGIFNFWNTAVPVMLGNSPLKKLIEIMANQNGPSWLYEGHEAPICLEYVWQIPTHMWISRNISTKSNGRYFVDTDKFRSVCHSEGR